MSGTGRKQDLIWHHFDRTPHKKGWKAKCKYCGRDMMGRIWEMQKHLESKCEAVPSDVKVRVTSPPQLPQTEARSYSGASSSALLSDLPSEASPALKRSRQALFKVSSSRPMNAEELKAFELQVGKFVASANLPFTVVENCEFQKLCTMLRGPSCVRASGGARWAG